MWTVLAQAAQQASDPGSAGALSVNLETIAGGTIFTMLVGVFGLFIRRTLKQDERSDALAAREAGAALAQAEQERKDRVSERGVAETLLQQYIDYYEARLRQTAADAERDAKEIASLQAQLDAKG